MRTDRSWRSPVLSPAGRCARANHPLPPGTHRLQLFTASCPSAEVKTRAVEGDKSWADGPDDTSMWLLSAIRRRLASETFGSEIFLAVGGVFLVVGILDLRETRRVRAEGELARGKVTGRHRSGGRSTGYSLDVEFQTRAGVGVRLTQSVGRSRYERTRPGDTVPLHYLPSDPAVMKIGATPQLDPRGFIASLSTFILAGVIYLLGKRRKARPAVQITPSPIRPRQKLIVMLVAAGLGVALPFFLIPRLPPRGRHEYLLEGQVLSIALDRKEASIKHDAVNGLGPATTMSYNVPNAGELAALKPGALITATLVVVRDDTHLEDIKVVAAR